ncbi:MAG: UPF0323 family lipoprotein [Helicobacter sp.]|nr:UPF0323 family lipoprotein [Helicobacter sp.]
MKLSKIKDYAMVGSLGVAVAFVLHGCEDAKDSQVLHSQSLKNGAFVVIEEQVDGTYKVLEEYPSENTRVMLKDKNGNERMLTQGEIDNLIAQEERKIDSGTSELINPNAGGLGLGGAILASAAGAILGSYLGNKLFNNPNYQNNAQRNYKSPQAYERSQNSFNNNKGSATKTPSGSNAKSGFFGNNNKSAGKSSSPMGA